MKNVFLLLLILSAPAMAQDGTYEGLPVYDTTIKPTFLPIRLPVLGGLNHIPVVVVIQPFTATFTFTRRLDGSNQQEADRKLAAYLAAYAEAKGKSGLCVVAGDGACLSVDGAIIYDLAKVSAAIEAILTKEIDDAARDRFKGPKLEEARRKADEDFDKEEKPAKAVIAPRSTRRRPR